ncbi:MAG: gamma-glutamylcyclotransferase [Candidatus Aureabacteria bacterium]|nr:gamma-glutamylcyclotransferase [Candidatus Auribacterota bacterium]
MRESGDIRLFVYGTLAYDRNMRAITGRLFAKIPAVLEGYERISPPHRYTYILPREGSSVHGYLLSGLNRKQLKQIDLYEAEGEMYCRRRVRVKAGGKEVTAYAYIANRRRANKYFGFDEAERIRDFLKRKLEKLIAAVNRVPGKKRLSQRETAVCRELLGGTIEELIHAHFNYPFLPEEEIKNNLLNPGIPKLEKVRTNPAILKYADAYLLFALRHIVFNQIEERMAASFHDVVKLPDEYYEHAVSNLLALKYVNAHKEKTDELISEMGCGRFRNDWEYVEHARCGVRIAEKIYDREEAHRLAEWIKKNCQPGATPLGAELEFSTIGPRVIGAREGDDPVYDGFHYFHDFDLLRRGWKLGMYVDNHKAVSAPGERSRGFLEYAFGRYKILGDLSKPVANDPWLLAELIREATTFCGIPPHSLHLSFQISPDIPYGKIERVSDLFCLLLLGGDIRRDGAGHLTEQRIANHEIEDPSGGVYFSKENFHSRGDGSQSKVIEYQFPRLMAGIDYTPLIMALKGFHLAGNPHPVNPFMKGADYTPGHPLLVELKKWAENPHPVTEKEIVLFLECAERGLKKEADGRPAHKVSFIRRALDAAGDRINRVSTLLR